MLEVARRTSAGAVLRRILLVDDEQRILGFVSRGLRNEGYDVELASTGEEGLTLALSGGYDLVILDLLMPGLDGASVLRTLLHRRPKQMVIVLSCLSDTASKVAMLELGADDYLAKPFSLTELVARVHARFRSSPRVNMFRLAGGRVVLDLDRQVAETPARRVRLTQREVLLLGELARAGGGTLSKEHLLNAVWGFQFDPGSNIVDVCVARVRAKLGPDAILTVRGEGYRLEPA